MAVVNYTMNKITIESIDYANPNDRRVLKACLTNWFRNPKDLNLTDPRQRYPFNFQRWIDSSYNHDNIQTFVLKQNRLIIGHVSLQILRKERRVHLFHLFVAREYRGFGYGKQLIRKVESVAKRINIPMVTLRVVSNNTRAIHLYESLGYEQFGIARNKSLKLKKQFT